MSKMVQIRNVPDDIHRKLKMKAAKEGVSLSEFLLREAKREAETPNLSQWLDMVAHDPPANLGLTAEDIVNAIHEEREERADHIEQVLREAQERHYHERP